MEFAMNCKNLEISVPSKNVVRIYKANFLNFCKNKRLFHALETLTFLMIKHIYHSVEHNSFWVLPHVVLFQQYLQNSFIFTSLRQLKQFLEKSNILLRRKTLVLYLCSEYFTKIPDGMHNVISACGNVRNSAVLFSCAVQTAFSKKKTQSVLVSRNKASKWVTVSKNGRKKRRPTEVFERRTYLTFR